MCMRARAVVDVLIKRRVCSGPGASRVAVLLSDEHLAAGAPG